MIQPSLAPCPFCASPKVHLVKSGGDSDKDGYQQNFQCVCLDCGAKTASTRYMPFEAHRGKDDYDTPEGAQNAAVAAWNRRA